MKMLFTKYLPVEGEIKDGTKVMFLINNKWTEPCDFDSFLGPQIKKVAQGKLFLCSKDNPKYAQEILTSGIKEGQEFTEEEKDFLTLGSVIEI